MTNAEGTTSRATRNDPHNPKSLLLLHDDGSMHKIGDDTGSMRLSTGQQARAWAQVGVSACPSDAIPRPAGVPTAVDGCGWIVYVFSSAPQVKLRVPETEQGDSVIDVTQLRKATPHEVRRRLPARTHSIRSRRSPPSLHIHMRAARA